ncbi:hypothetical protein ACOMHN_048783 [Nucella lapillus]
MEQRTVGHYRQVLQAVKTAVRQVTHHQWRPQLIITDFELSLTTAIDTEFPQARTGRCYFHFNQSLWKRIQQLGLAGPYQQDRHLMKQVKMIMALGYLQVALVLMNFNGLAGSRRTRRLLRRYPALRDFLDYVRTINIHPGRMSLSATRVERLSAQHGSADHVCDIRPQYIMFQVYGLI